MAILPGDINVRAVMQGTTLLAEDRYVNDFAFRLGDGTVAPTLLNLADLLGAVDGFYNEVTAGGNQVAAFISEAVSRAVTHEIEFHSILNGGSPILSSPWLGPQAPSVANANMPTEVAGALSFHADLTGLVEEAGATRPRARRRGRVFVGPLTTQAITPTDDNPRLSAGFTLSLRQAATFMADEAAAAGWTWSVWSRTGASLYPIVGGWTDNAPDTMRKRGVEASARVVYSV